MLNAKNLGIAAGIVSAVIVFFLTLLCSYNEYGKELFEFLEKIYPGYSISWLGSLVGALYAFIDGFFYFFCIAWLYNRLSQDHAKA